MAGRSKSRWTRGEIEAARMFGTERIPNNGFGQPDFIVPPTYSRPAIAVQVKTRAELPAWFTDAMKQAVLDADAIEDREDAIPAVVVVHAPGQGRKKQRFAILRLQDAVTLLGDTPAPDPDATDA